MSGHVKVIRTDERIAASCRYPGCGLAALAANKPLGRERITAFVARHQHANTNQGEAA